MLWSPHDKQIQKKDSQNVEFDEDLAEILKVKDNTSFSSLLLNEKKLDLEMISSNSTIWGSFEILMTSRFQNCPLVSDLMKI